VTALPDNVEMKKEVKGKNGYNVSSTYRSSATSLQPDSAFLTRRNRYKTGSHHRFIIVPTFVLGTVLLAFLRRLCSSAGLPLDAVLPNFVNVARGEEAMGTAAVGLEAVATAAPVWMCALS
jgi:hypothetical protein